MSKQAKNGPLRRWVHQDGGDELDVHLGDVFRSIEGEPGLPPSTLAQVRRRLARGPAPGRRRALRLTPLVLALVTAGATAALANWAAPTGFRVQQLFAPTPSAAPTVPQAPRLASPKPEAAPPAPGDGEQAELAAPAGEAPSTSVVRPLDVSPLRAPTRASAAIDGSATPSAIALESALLQRALSALRRERDAKSALKLLDEYQGRYPNGVLGLEAAVARVDALLLAGMRAEALERLARLPLERVGRRSELQLVRAELYSERDCAKANADFSAVLLLDNAGPFAERALYGRATCRLRQRDPAAMTDFRSYLARYPNGRFAEAVRQQLAGT